MCFPCAADTYIRFLACFWLIQFESKVIPEAQKAEQALKRNVTLDEANTRLSAQVQVSTEKAKRCERSALQWQDQLDSEKAAHRSVNLVAESKRIDLRVLVCKGIYCLCYSRHVKQLISLGSTWFTNSCQCKPMMHNGCQSVETMA